MNVCYAVPMHRVLSIQRQVAHCLLLKTNELCLSSLLNFHSELWVNPRVPRKPFQPRGPLEISCPREKYNIRKGQKPQKPLKIQGSSLVVPIISLSPEFLWKSCESAVIFEHGFFSRASFMPARLLLCGFAVLFFRVPVPFSVSCSACLP